jgi:hypothetical protein
MGMIGMDGMVFDVSDRGGEGGDERRERSRSRDRDREKRREGVCEIRIRDGER